MHLFQRPRETALADDAARAVRQARTAMPTSTSVVEGDDVVCVDPTALRASPFPATASAPPTGTTDWRAWKRHLIDDNPALARVGFAAARTFERRQEAWQKAHPGRSLPWHLRTWPPKRKRVVGWSVYVTFLLGLNYFLVTYGTPSVSFFGPMFGPLFGLFMGGAASAMTGMPLEREKGTWNALLLSRLTPVQLIFAALWPATRVGLTMSALVMPVLLILAVRLGWNPAIAWVGAPILAVCAIANGVQNANNALFAPSVKAAAAQGRTVFQHMAPFLVTALVYLSSLAWQIVSGASIAWIHVFHTVALLPTMLLTPLGVLSFALPSGMDIGPGFQPVFAAIETLRPFFLPVFLGVTATRILSTWRRMLRDFERAPRDHGG
jgi:hypothetical protein